MSLSMPNTCRIDTFMSGRMAASGLEIIVPPWPRASEARAISVENPALFSRLPRGEKAVSRGSAKACGFQIVIGLNDLAQPVLGGAIAAIRIGMVALHQGLETRLDLGAGSAELEAERVERLALGIADHPA